MARLTTDRDAKSRGSFRAERHADAVTAGRMHDDEVPVSVDLVARLIAEQYPHWADLALRPVEPRGTDNAIWRLGEDLVVRLPRIAWAKEQPAKEAKWLPLLASYLPVAVPEPVALGRPDSGHPFAWTVHRWLPGEPSSRDTIGDYSAFADSMIDVIRGLSNAPPMELRSRTIEPERWPSMTKALVRRSRVLQICSTPRWPRDLRGRSGS